MDWLVEQSGIPKKELSVLEVKPKTASNDKSRSDFIKLVKEGVDISNANLKNYGADPVYPLIQAEGTPFSSFQACFIILFKIGLSFTMYGIQRTWEDALLLVELGKFECPAQLLNENDYKFFYKFCSATLAYKVITFVSF